MSIKSELIEKFYSEAIQHEVGSDSYMKSARNISAFYRDNFGADKTWLDYVSSLGIYDKTKSLELLSVMKIELIKLHKS